jgi:hypothetical protein
MAAAAADCDNDGLTDLFVAGVKGNIPYRNLGNGRFADITIRAGLATIGRSRRAGSITTTTAGLISSSPIP